MNPIEKLKSEHQIILRGIDILENGATLLEKGENVPAEFFRKAIEFIRNYADQYHHAKEENILFADLGKAGFSLQAGPVAVMLHEHTEGRQYVARLAEATDRFAAGDRSAVDGIIRNALNYANLLRQHIQKEDLVLYPMAENILGNAGIDRMQTGFEKVEIESGGTEARYLSLLDTMKLEKEKAES